MGVLGSIGVEMRVLVGVGIGLLGAKRFHLRVVKMGVVVVTVLRKACLLGILEEFGHFFGRKIIYLLDACLGGLEMRLQGIIVLLSVLAEGVRSAVAPLKTDFNDLPKGIEA